ncbi:glycine--tRNA ligase subunit beta [Halofilum ochraceum]|uniref:glycine--tRNA ligase subunit beta n=1 Tax=Halofilum ochraceum TaxID=1611323 RepID=UPI00082E00D8|nr:glycine--tRNA ligase subunit beta [Halofilum ochraceum]
MAEARDLLVEIGTEELPSSELKALMDAFGANLATALQGARIGFTGEPEPFATPRRLAVRLNGVASAQTAESVEHRGPPVSAAFAEDGTPTKAAEGFAGRHGVAVADLERRDTGKAEYLFHTEHQAGQATVELLPELVTRVLNELPAKKRMRWGVPGVSFPRPVHWAVLLFGEQAVDAELLGVRTGRASRGHRFHYPAAIELGRPADYESLLLDPGHLVAGFADRQARIREQVIAAGREAGGEADIDPELLEEVASLVEWPVALAGRFDRRFLDVPAEALVAVMKDHQKYFPVYDGDGALLPAFVTVSNIASADPEVVRHGNERVIEPRFADAEFFWQQDRRQPLESRLEGLKAMVFQRRLGTLHDRTQRIESLAGRLAGRLGADTEATATAARLAKCDLLTEMVGEFPELQGLMGGYYAAAEGYAETVALAIADQYRPAFAGDALPRTREGQALALADRLDVLMGIFAIGRAPTGDKDPFALRRAALGALRIIVEGGLDLDLETALQEAAAAHDPAVEATAGIETVFDFMMERFRVYYTAAGFAPDLFEAVRACRPSRPVDFDARIRALHAFGERTEAASLTEANKRIRNILRKADDEVGSEPDPGLFADDAERDLAGAVAGLDNAIGELVAARDYAGALARLAALAEPLDRFFDGVMVMADDAALRANRIALLGRARGLFLRIADLSRVQ